MFCERQCALIHVEGIFLDNALTAEGHILHKSVCAPGARQREGIRVETDVWLTSERLGLTGRADRVESWSEAGLNRVRPVESKRARRRSLHADSVQLCAQAMALEEMRAVLIEEGELYYVNPRRRLTIRLTAALRDATREAAERFHALVQTRTVPAAHQDARCSSCSLKDPCLPQIFDGSRTIEAYLQAAWSSIDPC